MSRIQLLEDHIINKIAAGEVVDRPASIVKELIENAIDAGASRITIELEDGGKKRILVQDNGGGIAYEDAPLAIERHATSKIRNIDDLYQITTMGFRGEALSSIASVSRFTLLTKRPSQEHGAKVICNGGLETSCVPVNPETGTTVVVEDLFYNVPVRAGFLKQGGTEYAHCLELVQAIALTYSQVSFYLTHNRKTQLIIEAIEHAAAHDAEGVNEAVLRRRSEQILGKELCSQLLFVKKTSDQGCFAALISSPGFEKPTTKFIYTFVNQRWVKDKTVRFGIMRGYHSHLLKGKYPVVIGHLTIDPTLVDVNVHPSKTELRFQYAQEVQDLIAHAIRSSLRSGAWAAPVMPSVKTPDDGALDSMLTVKEPGFQPELTGFNLQRVSSGKPPYKAESSSFGNFKTTLTSFDGVQQRVAAKLPELEFSKSIHIPETTDNSKSIYQVPWDECSFIGSFARCYLLFEYDRKLLVLDQHAFHERILFEQLTADQSLVKSSQPLIVPESIQLPSVQVQYLKSHISIFEKLGFKVNCVDWTTIEVLAIPVILLKANLSEVIHLLSCESPAAGDNSVAAIAHHVLATMACHGAIRSGDELADQDLKQLLQQAKNVDFYYNCPHGRRVLRWFDEKDIAQWFDRL